MKILPTTTTLNLRFAGTPIYATSAIVVVLFVSGCSKAPEAPTPAQQQQSLNSQIQSIQNSPSMSEQAKQQAIAGIKAQQGGTTTQP